MCDTNVNESNVIKILDYTFHFKRLIFKCSKNVNIFITKAVIFITKNIR